MKHSGSIWVILGDVLGLVVFALLGQSTHNSLQTNWLMGVLLTALPFVGAWLVTGFVFGVWQKPPTLMGMLGRLWLAWLIAAPLGVGLRLLSQGRSDLPWIFVLTTLGFGGLILTVWRLGAWWGLKPWQTSPPPPAGS